jgi:hypothetical protein
LLWRLALVLPPLLPIAARYWRINLSLVIETYRLRYKPSR